MSESKGPKRAIKRRSKKAALKPPEVEAGARHSFTDDGNASRFAEDHKGKLIYVSGPGWHRWTGKRWKPVLSEDILKEARLTARQIRRECLVVSEGAMEATARWARRSAERSRLEAMFKLAQGGDDLRHADLKIDIGQLDRNLDILNTPSGVVDLRSGSFVDSAEGKAEYCTRITGVSFIPNVDQTTWLEFVERVVPDPALRSALQLCAGASITGRVPKAIFALVGESGDNGKTQFIEAVQAVLGDYASTAMESTFTSASAREAGYDLAQLRGTRFLAFSETRHGHGLAAERIKRHTGGDRITARSPYGKPFSFDGQFSLWMATNHPPRIPANEHAMWNRVWAFPFEVAIPKNEQIPDYGDRLVRQHGPAVLGWLIDGASQFYRQNCKLGPQPTVMQARRTTWQERDDVVKRWLDEMTEPAPRRRTRFPDLWASFQAWCECNGEAAFLRDYTSQQFHAEMDAHYPRTSKKSAGYYSRTGVVLRVADA